MSADNGIYIGRFIDEQGQTTYRVIHAQAIENCDRSEDFPAELTDSYRVLYYGRSQAVSDRDEALKKADELYQIILRSEFPILEYGICYCEYDEPFPAMTYEEANQYQQTYWENHFHQKWEKERQRE